MHWLRDQLNAIHTLLERYEKERARDTEARLAGPQDRMLAVASGDGAATRRAVDAVDASSSRTSSARRAFHEALTEAAEGICARRGITACVVAHEGLVVTQSGAGAMDDALAATTQVCLSTANGASSTVELGHPRQMVIVGDDQKIALFFVGQMVVGILSPADTVLAETLSR